MSQSPIEAILPADNKFRIWGGAGEPETKVEINVEGAEKSGGDKSGAGAAEGGTTEDAGGDGSDDAVANLEKKLDQEKQKRIQLQKERDKELEGKAKEFENTEAERDSYKEKYEQLLKYVETTALDTAIIKASGDKYVWEDVEAVRVFIDQDNIRLDIDTQKFDGIEGELKRIAKEKPYLLKKPEDAGAGNGQPFVPADQRSTGNQPFGAAPRARETDPNKLRTKYKMPGAFAGAPR